MSSARSPLYSYGLLLALAYLAGLQLALVRARRAASRRRRVMDLGIWIIISALVGAKLLLLVVDFDTFSQNPRELLSLAQSGGVFYGGLILAVAVALLVHAAAQACRCGRPATCSRRASRSATSSAASGCFLAGCCWGRPTDVPWAVTLHRSVRRANVGTPLNVHLHPTQLYEAGAELLILSACCWSEKRGRPFPGRTFWSYMLLYAHHALHHRDLPRRPARHGARRPVDVAVHLGHPGAAQPDHALASVASARPGSAQAKAA